MGSISLMSSQPPKKRGGDGRKIGGGATDWRREEEAPGPCPGSGGGLPTGPFLFSSFLSGAISRSGELTDIVTTLWSPNLRMASEGRGVGIFHLAP